MSAANFYRGVNILNELTAARRHETCRRAQKARKRMVAVEL
jgi:hypothetical protein